MSPTRKTGRMSRWSAIAPPAGPSSGASSASSCCWPASAAWSGTSLSQPSAGRTRTVADDAIRCLGCSPTPSQRATVKYFFVVARIVGGADCTGSDHRPLRRRGIAASTAFRSAKWLPYTVTRTWHMQLGIFWIATAWLATGLYIAPAVSGDEPKCQRSASTCCSARCSSSSSARWPASG